MKKIYLCSITVLLLFRGLSFAQLLEENFNYTASDATELEDITSTLWESTLSTGAAIFYNSSLTYSGYASSGIGGMASTIKGTVRSYADFSSTNSGSLFYSFLIRLTNLPNSTAEYPIALTSTANGSSYFTKVWLQGDGSKFRFGLSKAAASPSIVTNYDYTVETTYLIVVRYDFISGTSNDLIKLYVFSGNSIGSTEESNNANYSSTLYDENTNGDASALINFAIRQRNLDDYIGIKIDGIRIGTSWSQAPVPVELSSFSAFLNGNAVNLKWETKTEVENYGFEIERASTLSSSIQGWMKIGFINGSGNSNSPKDYTFTDRSVSNGKYIYRLKQIDTDGKYEFSKEVEVDLGTPKTYYLGQNYPNPFNPSTKINYSLPADGEVKLAVFTVEGELVKTLVNGKQNAGTYTIEFDGSNLASGTYLYKLIVNNFIQIKKMLLTK